MLRFLEANRDTQEFMDLTLFRVNKDGHLHF